MSTIVVAPEVYWILGGFGGFLLFLLGIVISLKSQVAVVQSNQINMGAAITALGNRFDIFIKQEKDAFEDALQQNTQALKDLAK